MYEHNRLVAPRCYGSPKPAAWERCGSHRSVPPGPASSEAEHFFPAGTRTNACLQHIYTYIHASMAGHTDQHRQTLSAHTKHKQHQHPHPAPLPGWPGWRSVSGKYVNTNVQGGSLPAAALRRPVCPVAAPGSQSPQSLAPGHTSPEAAAPLQLWYRPLLAARHANARCLEAQYGPTVSCAYTWRASSMRPRILTLHSMFYSCNVVLHIVNLWTISWTDHKRGYWKPDAWKSFIVLGHL